MTKTAAANTTTKKGKHGYVDINGREIAATFKAMGLTQQDVAKKLHIPLATFVTALRAGRMKESHVAKLRGLLPAPSPNGKANGAAHLPAIVPPQEPTKRLRIGNQGAMTTRAAITIPTAQLALLLALVQFAGGKILALTTD